MLNIFITGLVIGFLTAAMAIGFILNRVLRAYWNTF